MRRTTAGALVAAMLATGALVGSSSAAAASPAAKIAALQKQVAALNKRLKRQERLAKQLTNALTANFIGDGCLAAVSADAIQSTWMVVDTFAGQSLFGAQQPIADRNACSSLQRPTVTRQGLRTPPTVAAFTSLMGWLVPTAQYALAKIRSLG